MAVLTNKPVRPARGICEGLGMADYFLHIYGGDSFPVKKPDPLGAADPDGRDRRRAGRNGDDRRQPGGRGDGAQRRGLVHRLRLRLRRRKNLTGHYRPIRVLSDRERNADWPAAAHFCEIAD